MMLHTVPGLAIIIEPMIPIQVKDILTGGGTDTCFPLAEQIMYCISQWDILFFNFHNIIIYLIDNLFFKECIILLLSN